MRSGEETLKSEVIKSFSSYNCITTATFTITTEFCVPQKKAAGFFYSTFWSVDLCAYLAINWHQNFFFFSEFPAGSKPMDVEQQLLDAFKNK